MSLSLRTLFSTAFAVIIILLTAMLSYVIGNRSTTSVEVGIGSSLAAEANQMSEKLDHFMWSRSGEIEVLSKLNAFQEPVEPAEAGGLLNQLKKSLPVFTWVGFLDMTGNVVASTDRILQGTNISQRPVFQQALKGTFIGDVHDAVLLSKLLPNPTGEALQFVDVSVPVMDKQGQTSGVLAAHLSWEWSREVEASIVNPLKERLKGVEVFVVSKKDDTILLGPEAFTGKRMTDAVLQQARSGKSSYVIEQERGRDSYLTGYAYGDGYMNYPGLGWTVIIRQPADIAFASVHQLERFILISGLLTAAVFALIGWLLAGWISRPLRDITRTADLLSSGADVEIPASTRFKDVAILSASLRSLVNNLTKTETKLSYMSDMALHDKLTGLPNRAALDEFLTHAVSKAKQKRTTLSFLYMDLDGFKKVNDSFGHAVGDALLQEVAFRLMDCTRDNEIVARLGGDEFVIILNTSAAKPMKEAEVVASRIISKINQPIVIKGEELHVGCSVGAAVWTPDGGDTTLTLRLADEALYISKRSGKNRITFEAAS
ncbi:MULTISPECIES: sensor domain-containing diguanylate cyclase [unclassified Paenibacillus]|uniref:sensor domain-containing diguanylate cyclase n=1 Tax=unclassified Paenibacillus TaxID=185978 RepID=UPI0003E23F94|nr:MULTISPECIES: sensor domain-containing diguanylate cyclase [unclassified Paenibacillus]ETT50710.1 diguanylate cyclase [Paenibacillus sp. FSL R7-269]OMG01211.1 diguanylate cyclase [Paenibacillus sp. FSL R7-0337]